MSEFEQAMAELDGEFTEEELGENKGGSLLPDGRHQVVVRESRVEWAFDSIWQFVLKFGNDQGVITKWQNLDNEIGRKIALSDARMMGYEGTKISGLEAACESGLFLNLVCEIGIVTKPGEKRDFTNIYLNKVLGRAQGEFTPAAAEDDGIPF